MFVVYILRSEKTGKYYCGQTNDIAIRLEKHNLGFVKSTKHGAPWNVIKTIYCQTRADAMKLETHIKKRGIERWITDDK
jgi:putative endonuclease